jgi:hypothetical protein
MKAALLSTYIACSAPCNSVRGTGETLTRRLTLERQ